MKKAPAPMQNSSSAQRPMERSRTTIPGMTTQNGRTIASAVAVRDSDGPGRYDLAGGSPARSSSIGDASGSALTRRARARRTSPAPPSPPLGRRHPRAQVAPHADAAVGHAVEDAEVAVLRDDERGRAGHRGAPAHRRAVARAE